MMSIALYRNRLETVLRTLRKRSFFWLNMEMDIFLAASGFLGPGYDFCFSPVLIFFCEFAGWS